MSLPLWRATYAFSIMEEVQSNQSAARQRVGRPACHQCAESGITTSCERAGQADGWQTARAWACGLLPSLTVWPLSFFNQLRKQRCPWGKKLLLLDCFCRLIIVSCTAEALGDLSLDGQLFSQLPLSERRGHLCFPRCLSPSLYSCFLPLLDRLARPSVTVYKPMQLRASSHLSYQAGGWDVEMCA